MKAKKYCKVKENIWNQKLNRGINRESVGKFVFTNLLYKFFSSVATFPLSTIQFLVEAENREMWKGNLHSVFLPSVVQKNRLVFVMHYFGFFFD